MNKKEMIDHIEELLAVDSDDPREDAGPMFNALENTVYMTYSEEEGYELAVVPEDEWQRLLESIYA